MSQKPFGIEQGLELEDVDTGAITQILPILDTPNTTATDNAPVSSTAQSANGKIYKKHTAGAGANNWSELVDKDYVDASASGLSWREPALVFDGAIYADLTAAETALNVADTADGITIVDGSRIVYPNITGENSNVHIVSGSTGAWTLTEDANSATDGDALYVQEGTEADKQFSYSGSAWVQVSGSTDSEIAYLQAFIGKGANGAELPAYTSNNFITDNDSLEVALGKVDAQLALNASASGGNATDITNLQTEINAVETSLGAVVDASGAYVAHTGTNYLDGNTSITGDLLDLDTQIKINADDINDNALALVALQTELDDTQAGAGLGTNGNYTADAGSDYLTGASTLYEAIHLLDAEIATLALGSNEDGFIRSFIGKSGAGSETPTYSSVTVVTQGANLEVAVGELDAGIDAVDNSVTALATVVDGLGTTVTGTGITTITTVDTVSCSAAAVSEWQVRVLQGSNVVSLLINAVNNAGIAGTPVATVVDSQTYVKNKIGSIVGLKVKVGLSGSDMILTVEASSAVSVVARRAILNNV